MSEPVRSPADPLQMAEAYQRTAIVASAVETGIADALAPGGRSAEEISRECSTHPRATSVLLGALVALGLAHENGGRFGLTGAGTELAGDHQRTVARIVAKEWFFYAAWAGLPETVADGHARIPPWRERLREDSARSLDFLRALDDLAARFGGELPRLVGGLGAGRLLDVGGGAGSHAANLVAANPGLSAVVLDLPDVGPLVRERHPELAFVAGDLEVPRFGRPAGESWDAVLLANVLHDLPADRASTVVAEAAALLAPGGSFLVYDWVLEERRSAPAAVAVFAVMMMVENEGGAAYTAGEIEAWASGAGLVDVSLRRGQGPIAVLRASAPERPRSAQPPAGLP